MNNLPAQLREVHASFAQGRLQFVVGAGASISAGLPSWASLNQRLIRQLFYSVFGESSSPKFDVRPFPLEDEEITELSQMFIQYFGRDAIVDLFREQLNIANNKQHADDEVFLKTLYDALYSDISSFDLQPIHREIAAALLMRSQTGKNAYVYTLNYDDAIEQALAQVVEKPPKTLTKWTPGNPIDDHCVVHLHGSLPLKNNTLAYNSVAGQSDIILSEKDYLRSVDNDADTFIRDLFENHNTDVLLVGMSLDDPRIRRLLYRRASSQKNYHNNVWVLLSHTISTRENTSVSKKGRRFIEHFLPHYWHSWGVKTISCPTHELVPCYLRAVRLGVDVRHWIKPSIDFLQKEKVYDRLYSKENQARKQIILMQQYDFIRKKFEVSQDEELVLSFFIPFDKRRPYLQPAYVFTGDQREHRRTSDWDEYPYDASLGLSPGSQFVENNKVRVHLLTEGHAKSRRLNVSSWE